MKWICLERNNLMFFNGKYCRSTAVTTEDDIVDTSQYKGYILFSILFQSEKLFFKVIIVYFSDSMLHCNYLVLASKS